MIQAIYGKVNNYLEVQIIYQWCLSLGIENFFFSNPEPTKLYFYINQAGIGWREKQIFIPENEKLEANFPEILELEAELKHIASI